jgi:hypothetical protein
MSSRRKGIQVKTRTTKKNPATDVKQKHKTTVQSNHTAQPAKVGAFSKDVVYVRNLKAAGRFFCLHPQEAFILANCASNGELVRDYCLLQPVHFHDQTSEIKLLTCSCPSSLDQSARLHATSSVITENLQQFKDREVSLYCIHR